MKLKIYASCFFIALFAFSTGLFAQETVKKYTRTITVSQFIKEIQDTTEEAVLIKNTNIVADEVLDRRFLYGASIDGRRFNWDSILTTYPLITVKKPLYLMDVRFGQRTVLPKIQFNELVHVERVDVYGDLNFRGCFFQKRVYCVNLEAYFFGFYKSEFFSNLYLESLNTEQTTVQNCLLNKGFVCYQNDEPLNLDIVKCKIKGDVGLQSLRQGGDVNIMQTIFEASNAKQDVAIGGIGFLNRLIFYQDTFKMPLNLSFTTIKDNFSVIKTQLYPHNTFENLNLPENNTNLRWELVKNEKFGVKIQENDTLFFNGKSKITEETEENYYALIKVYSQFLRAYKNNGDQESYNACYIEMKDIQTRKAAFNFHRDPSLNNYFDWKLNRFLKIFCDYGTNPVKALLFSVFVIFLFGVLYFIFPSEGKTIDWRRFNLALKNHKKMMPILKKESIIGAKQMLNAMALSMNAFVTLGYGDMPARGVARYLAVFEGLTGWFLLSIFSASLISQILQ